MMLPKKTDGSEIRVLSLPDGRVYVDIPPPKQQYMNTRGGPHYPRHYCRWEDYGLVDQDDRPLVRCRHCARVMPNEWQEDAT